MGALLSNVKQRYTIYIKNKNVTWNKLDKKTKTCIDENTSIV